MLFLDPVGLARYEHVGNLVTLRTNVIFGLIGQMLPEILSFLVESQCWILTVEFFVASEVVESVHIIFHILNLYFIIFVLVIWGSVDDFV